MEGSRKEESSQKFFLDLMEVKQLIDLADFAAMYVCVCLYVCLCVLYPAVHVTPLKEDKPFGTKADYEIKLW